MIFLLPVILTANDGVALYLVKRFENIEFDFTTRVMTGVSLNFHPYQGTGVWCCAQEVLQYNFHRMRYYDTT